jgi:hypothetical protein
MRIVISEFISLDGVVQAPGGPEEDTGGGFAHGGWSHPYFGKTIFREDGTKRPLEHVSTTTAKTGVDVSVYRPVRED